jgi:hypothetical protein
VSSYHILFAALDTTDALVRDAMEEAGHGRHVSVEGWHFDSDAQLRCGLDNAALSLDLDLSERGQVTNTYFSSQLRGRGHIVQMDRNGRVVFEYEGFVVFRCPLGHDQRYLASDCQRCGHGPLSPVPLSGLPEVEPHE